MATDSSARGARPRYRCSLCGAEWSGRGTSPPVRCPRCASKRWRTGNRHHCSLCGYDWVSVGRNPFKCPSCQSTRWNEKDHGNIASVPEEVKIPILLRYDSGAGCVAIARELGITFEIVYDVVREAHPDGAIKF